MLNGGISRSLVLIGGAHRFAVGAAVGRKARPGKRGGQLPEEKGIARVYRRASVCPNQAQLVLGRAGREMLSRSSADWLCQEEAMEGSLKNRKQTVNKIEVSEIGQRIFRVRRHSLGPQIHGKGSPACRWLGVRGLPYAAVCSTLVIDASLRTSGWAPWAGAVIGGGPKMSGRRSWTVNPVMLDTAKHRLMDTC